MCHSVKSTIEAEEAHSGHQFSSAEIQRADLSRQSPNDPIIPMQRVLQCAAGYVLQWREALAELDTDV